MTLWWSKHIYSPYDLYLDRTYAHGVLQKVESDSRKRQVASHADHAAPLRCAFHTHYVLDIGLLLDCIARKSDRVRKLKQAIHEHPYLSDTADMKKCLGTVYVIPKIEPTRHTIGNSILALVRNRVIEAVDYLIHIQEEDNRLLQMRSSV